MVNIWDYAYEDSVRITDTSGKTYEGNIIDVSSAEEYEDGAGLDGQGEDDISLETFDGKIFGFTSSMIDKIDKI